MSTKTAKHRVVFETVRQRIESGGFQPGERIPSDAELVNEFKVSRPTVAKALQELERLGMVHRRPGSGTYVLETNDAERGLQFGLIIPGLGETEIFEPICAEMSRIAQSQEHTILWGSASQAGEDDGSTALELCNQYVRQGVAGVFFAPLVTPTDKDAINQEIVSKLKKANIPVILLDRDVLPYPKRSDIDFVGIDNRRAGHMITDHMIACGCRRLLFVAHPYPASTIASRVAGFTEAVMTAGLDFRPELVHHCNPKDRDYVQDLLNTFDPDGIVCGNDVTAAELLQALDALDVAVPDRIQVAGIDDVKFAELLRVPLTSVHQPCAAIGRSAMFAMLERLASPDVPARDILLNCHVVQRASTQSLN